MRTNSSSSTDLSSVAASRAETQEAIPHRHAVQFYENDETLLEGLTRSIGEALRSGNAAIVIATQPHRASLTARLKARGVDVDSAISTGRYLSVDASDIQSQFMVNGWPEPARFANLLGELIVRAKFATRSEHGRVVVFGEIVSLLWAAGKPEAAIHLEHLWNDLAATHAFNLHCAYPLGTFFQESHADAFQRICAEHSHVVPDESTIVSQQDEETPRQIAELQRQARNFQALAEDREKLAMALAVEIQDMRELHQLALRLSWLTLDQTLEEVAAAVITLHNTDLGLLSIIDQETGQIRVAAHIGFSKDFLTFMKKYPEAVGACGASLKRRERVIVYDTDVDPIYADCREVAKIGGFRAAHSTPLLDPSGNLLGVLSILFRRPHRPSHREMRLTDLYVRLVASAVDNARLYRKAEQETARRKEAQEALIQAEKLAATGRLAATIAHEINNPLEAVVNSIYLAKHTPGLPEAVIAHLDLADQELGRISSMAQQTLGFYRDNAQPIRFHVADAIHGVLTIYERKIRYKQLQVLVDAPSDLELFASQGELRQAFANLIANAIDASSDHGTICVKAHLSRDWRNSQAPGVAITVADNGCGMSPEVKKQLFTPFFTTKQRVGTGLGLWTTRNLVSKQGGFIRIRSRQSTKSWTVMSIFLPFHSEIGTEERSA